MDTLEDKIQLLGGTIKLDPMQAVELKTQMLDYMVNVVGAALNDQADAVRFIQQEQDVLCQEIAQVREKYGLLKSQLKID